MTPMEYSRNGKGIMAPKDMVLWNIVFRNGICNGERFKKIQYKRNNVNIN